MEQISLPENSRRRLEEEKIVVDQDSIPIDVIAIRSEITGDVEENQKEDSQ